MAWYADLLLARRRLEFNSMVPGDLYTIDQWVGRLRSVAEFEIGKV